MDTLAKNIELLKAKIEAMKADEDADPEEIHYLEIDLFELFQQS